MSERERLVGWCIYWTYRFLAGLAVLLCVALLLSWNLGLLLWNAGNAAGCEWLARDMLRDLREDEATRA